MSEENVEMVRAAYEPVSRGELDDLFRDVDPDFELTITTQAGGLVGKFRGRVAALKQVEELVSPFEAWSVRPDEFFAGADKVVAHVTIQARPRGGTVEIEVQNGHVWTIRQGRIRSMETYATGEVALEAAGLRE